MKFNCLTRNIITALCTTVLVSGCSKDETIESHQLTTHVITDQRETGWQVNQDWLTIDETQGLFLNEQRFGPKFRAEYGDRRESNFVTYDIANNRLAFFSLNKKSMTDLHFSQTLGFAVEGLCLYSPDNEAAQVFVLGDDSLGRQFLMNHSITGSTLLQPIRQFPIPPGSEYCAVNDRTQTLFISEENIGIWAYPASAEEELKRKIVDFVQPYGTLPVAAGPLAIQADTLYVASLGSAIITGYIPDNNQYTKIHEWHVSEHIKIEGMTVTLTDKGNVLSIFNDESAQLLRTRVETPDNKQRSQPSVPFVQARIETTPVESKGDAADDPAIWVNKSQPENSLVLGTNKQAGLEVYRLSGERIQNLTVGRVNNVDLRQGFTLQGYEMDIAAASHRDHRSISLFSMNPVDGHTRYQTEIITSLDDVYGLCMYAATDRSMHVFINDQDGRYEQYEISDSTAGWNGKKVREFSVASQPEGCVADDAQGVLFLGEENKAIWRISADKNGGNNPELVKELSDVLVADIEGMGLYHTENSSYLVVSSQGNNSYVIYNTEPPYELIGHFRIGMNSKANIDGASETDGLEVTSLPLGKNFPKGLLVVQDGRNVLPSEKQNFKLVSWEDVETALKINLQNN